MLPNAKPLLVVLALALIVFAVARPLLLRFTRAEDFDRRRNVWAFLTIVGFLSPSFWIFALLALPVMTWAAGRDSHPLALYLLLLFVVPPVEIPIPVVGINRLFEMSHQRLMAFAILLPQVMSARIKADKRSDPTALAVDVLLIAYGVWQLVLLVPYEAFTNTARRGFLFYLDTFLIYQAFSQMRRGPAQLADLLSVLCLSAFLFAPLAIFESVRGWLLYPGVAELWGSPNRDAWLFRGDSLRAQAGTGHSIPLGYVFAMALCAWMYLSSAARFSQTVKAAGIVTMTVGLFYTFARGSWISAALALLLYAFFSSPSHARFMKTVLMASAVAGVLAMTPIGRPVLDLLPIIGTAGQETIAYRQQLAEVSWSLVGQHPFVGNPFVMLQMEDLRQGQGGIIDLVNAYASVALFYGLPGLILFLAPALVALRGAMATRRYAHAGGEWDTVALGAALIACELADLFFMGTAGFSWFGWILIGLLVSYSRNCVEATPGALAGRTGNVLRGAASVSVGGQTFSP